ncbi:aminotransferase class V-fold PLP-dependent enzyme [Chelativorans xinjiangense]|uniref:aminotransferase class V-fold PLP-dependent enzyme n=1 Tax=Chelativorans xinjiangense TaxID=2681485 RepID=UPI0024833736|nr:aminotransferase class V-fold PLP-dependent enzyme [Chelativorans xinjiangense]
MNASGTMTVLGASRTVPEAQQAISEIADAFIPLDDLLDLASEAIQRLTGAEAGFVTASASSGLVLAVAACMTGSDRGRIMRLPDTQGMRTEAIIQVGHLVDYGTTVEMSLRLPGGKPVLVGSVSRTHDFQIESVVSERAACIVYVVSHHTVQYGMVPLERVVEIAHARDVLVIVDAASEYDLRGFPEKGADVVIYSGHKFLSGPTSGMMAGRKDLIHACRLQNLGGGPSHEGRQGKHRRPDRRAGSLGKA